MTLEIGNVKIKNRVVLAPMAGVSNPSFMKICEEMGVGYAITELISSEAIVRNNKKTLEMLTGIDELNIPYAIQLFGANAKVMGEAARIINELYPLAIIDINMGCPVPKVTTGAHAGSYLLKDESKVFDIVNTVVKSVKVPVTVKIRSGWDENSINAVEIAKVIERAGAKAISIHARTRSQGYSGAADWQIIKKVKDSVNIPVIGNGDITSPELALKMLNETGCDAVMIGRAVLGNPWLIKDTLNFLETNEHIEEVTIDERIRIMKKHFSLLKKNSSEKKALLEIRAAILFYLRGLPHAKEVKDKICTCKREEKVFMILENYLSKLKTRQDS